MSTESRYAPPPELAAWARRSLMVGIVGLAVSAVGAALDIEHFYRSYLIAVLYCLGFALGSLAIMMLHQLTGGAWGLKVRRQLEAASRTLPLIAVFFVPLYFAMPSLYLWARPDAVAGDPILEHKAFYLNVPFFWLRASIFFGIWIGLAALVSRTSLKQDQEDGQDEHPRAYRRMKVLGAIGIVTYAVTATFASVDWIMSLDPHWFSSMQGPLFIAGQALAGFAFIIPLASYLSQREPMKGVLGPQNFHDYGKLMFAFVVFWAYLAVSQFLIIWSGNLPEEITFYLERQNAGWKTISLFLVLGHFVVPFVVLLSRDLKRKHKVLTRVALWIIAMRWLELYWEIAPSGSHGAGPDLAALWIDLAAVAGLGGLWLWCFFRELGRRPLLPEGDPFLEEALADEH